MIRTEYYFFPRKTPVDTKTKKTQDQIYAANKFKIAESQNPDHMLCTHSTAILVPCIQPGCFLIPSSINKPDPDPHVNLVQVIRN